MNETPQWPTTFRSKEPIEDPELARKTWRNALWLRAANELDPDVRDGFFTLLQTRGDPKGVLKHMYDAAFPAAQVTPNTRADPDHHHAWEDVTERGATLEIEACECGAVRETPTT